MASFTPAQRAHTRHIMWLMRAYLLILPRLVWLDAHRRINPALVLLMAVVAALPLLEVFAGLNRYLSDEWAVCHQVFTRACSDVRSLAAELRSR